MLTNHIMRGKKKYLADIQFSIWGLKSEEMNFNLYTSVQHCFHVNNCFDVMEMLDRGISETHFLYTESLVSTSECLLCQKQLLPAPVQEPHSPALYTQPLHPAGQRQRHTLTSTSDHEVSLTSQSSENLRPA